MTRLIIALLLSLLIAYPVVPAVVRGLRTGKLAHSDTRAFVERSRAPLRFWLLMLFYVSLLGLCVWYVAFAARHAFFA
ncbi:MAG: hypothetical protein J0M09_08470 [Xanthomonadales bacterium]|jgi:hypothetical protein|nr:hypothetical protein [Xanthomonadales bacterium]